MTKELGKTQSVGFQFGIRKSFSTSSHDAWDFLFSSNGLNMWLGDLDSTLELKKEFRTKNGIHGRIRVLEPNSHIRMNWSKSDWDNISTLQLRVIKNNEKTTISFHQEKLINAQQREEMKTYWSEIMNLLSANLIDIDHH